MGASRVVPRRDPSAPAEPKFNTPPAVDAEVVCAAAGDAGASTGAVPVRSRHRTDADTPARRRRWAVRTGFMAFLPDSVVAFRRYVACFREHRRAVPRNRTRTTTGGGPR
jgi:hypothetical protein